ncbi:MAG TPA: LysR family transcriptional regulator [Ochrobactrum intermedium]|uniref:LysR family transcriptional regulator n=1 Tax=Brucella intermedia TaxID=94625 RepID=A0A7V6PA05_9HYPH|nr:LysR substrate-binding domain-containing protein [Brucella intermedia]HHV67038.1 LysR family transcriptional regulator [Brucella intermedia]
MKLLQLSAFREVMLTGTVSGAAAMLGRSQSAVSRILVSLEQELGVELFVRRRGQIVPTEISYQLLDEIERAYNSFESLTGAAARLAKKGAGQVHIAVMPAFGITFVPLALERFAKVHPNVRVSVDVRMSREIEERAVAQAIDFGLAELPLKRTRVHVEMFSNSSYVAIVPSDHALSEEKAISIEQLRGEKITSWPSFNRARLLLDHAFHSINATVDSRHETNFSITAYEMVRRRLGIAIIDPYTAHYAVRDGATMVPLAQNLPFQVGIIRPSSKPQNEAAESLISIMGQMRDEIGLR